MAFLGVFLVCHAKIFSSPNSNPYEKFLDVPVAASEIRKGVLAKAMQ